MTFNQVIVLTGSNFRAWKDSVENYIYMHELIGFCFLEEQPEIPATDDKPSVKAHYKKWMRSNMMAKTAIRTSMSRSVRGCVEEPELASDYLEAVSAKFKESEKAEIARLNKEYHSLQYSGTKPGGVRAHIMELININNRLREMLVGVKDQLLVHHALDSLPSSFDNLRTSYNAQEGDWSLDKLISICVDEETRIKKNESLTVNLVEKPKKKKTQNKLKPTKTITKAATGPKENKPFRFKCYFCKKVGHMKKDCTGYKAWLAKKGKIISNTVFSLEINLINVEPQSWWIDSGSPVHVTNSLQGFIKRRIPRSDEVNLRVGNGMRVGVKAIGTLKLDLGHENYFILDNVYYVPSIRRNLVSVSQLIKAGCRLLMDNNGILISRDSKQIGSGVISNGYLQLNCSMSQREISLVEQVNTNSTNAITGVKRTKQNEKSAYLWHRRLGHVSKERLKILVKNNILNELDFSDLNDCVECFKGKMTNKRKKTAVRSQNLLELIHTDICGPFKHQTICGNVYFITFIDDFSRYSYVSLLSEKSQALDAFKIFKSEVENQLERKIKTVRSDRGGEFYGKYTEKGQQKGPFALYLQEHGIKAQYTTPYNPQQNGVAERKNRTLLNMVRCMMCTTGLPKFLWGEALKTANYICNRTPSKAIEKTSFELWCGRKPSLHHCHVWGCHAEARVYNPNLSKLDSKSISCYFIGYPEKSKGYKLYSAKHKPRIFETHQVKFLNEKVHNAEYEDLSLDFEEIVTDEDWENALPFATEEIADDIIQENQDAEDQEIDQEMHVDEQPAAAQAAEPQNIAPQNDIHPEPPQNPELRRSKRARKSKFGGEDSEYIVYLAEADINEDCAEDNDPTNFDQAVASQDADKWQEAMQAEMESMEKNGVWELVEADPKQKPIGCKWVYKTKRDATGGIERHKARLVAKGFSQKEGIDYTETFSPVSCKDAFRIIMALVAHYDMELHQMDVKTAFLNGELEEVIYMKQPEGFIETGNENLVCRLRKSIYGLKQASRQWYKKFDSVISKFGFTENLVDECIYLKSVGNQFIFLVLYVDDILLASSNLKLLKDTKSFLSSNFDMKDLGEASYVLGIEIKRDRAQKLLGLSQQNYITKVLKRFSMEKCSSGEVPMSKGDKLTKGQSPQNEAEKEIMKTKPYARLVGSLMYAQVCTRPDLAFAVGMLSRFQSNPGAEHWVAGKKVLRYLQKTKNHMLVYRRVEDLKLVGFSDSDFAGNYPDSNKSTCGYVFMLAGGAVAWKTMKQTLITTSTMQAEYIAVYETMCEGLWIRNFLKQTKVLSHIVDDAIVIYCDNEAAVFFTKNNKRSCNSKHIDLKYYSVRERVKDGEVVVLNIDTNSQLADPFTKALPVKVFKKHAESIGILPNLDA